MGQDAVAEHPIARLHSIFSHFDQDGDGSLTKLELWSLLKFLGLNPDGAQLKQLVERVDLNHNDHIEFSELVNLFTPKSATEILPYSPEELVALFKAFDRDGNGYITAVELAHSMASLGRALSATELTGMIMEADVDGDGRISFTEFVNALRAEAAERAFLIIEDQF